MSSRDQKCASEIVFVEDNFADQEIARRVLGSQKTFCRLRILSDGQQALSYPNPVSNILKLPGVQQFSTLLDKLLQYWMQVAALPYGKSREHSAGVWVQPGGFL